MNTGISFNKATALFCKVVLPCFLILMSLGLCVADEITLRNAIPDSSSKTGKETKSLRGYIKEEDMSADEVNISPTQKKIETVPTTNIEAIKFEHEPREFDQIRNKILNKDYNGANEELLGMIADAEKKKTDLVFANELIKQEFEFFQVYLPAMKVLAGSSDQAPGKMAGPLLSFLNKHPKHYRYYEGMETIGHLSLLAGGDKKLEYAKKYYGSLSSSQNKEYKAHMNLFYARALISEGKFDEANPLLASVASEKSEVKSFASIIQQAKIAQASVQIGKGETDDAIKRLDQIIEETPKTDKDAHAWANLALGNAYLTKNLKVEAHLAFLHVELMYSNIPEVHAEALSKLAKLWNEIPNRNAESAAMAKEKLQNQYPHSKWNKA